MQTGPNDFANLIDRLQQLLEEGFSLESYRDNAFRNHMTEVAHQARVRFLNNPIKENAASLKAGMLDLQISGKRFKYKEINNLIDELVSNTKSKSLR